MAKTKALISFAVTAKLICVFVFAYAKCWFPHDAAHNKIWNKISMIVLNRVSKAVRISYATNEASKEISDYAWISRLVQFRYQ